MEVFGERGGSRCKERERKPGKSREKKETEGRIW